MKASKVLFTKHLIIFFQYRGISGEEANKRLVGDIRGGNTTWKACRQRQYHR